MFGQINILVMKLSYIIQFFTSQHLTTHGRSLAVYTDWPRYAAEWKKHGEGGEDEIVFLEWV